MAITGRAVLVMLVGVIAVALSPTTVTARLWWVAVLVGILLDVALALNPRKLGLTRLPTAPIRLGEATSTTLRVSNPSDATVNLVVRDAWPPSAGAAGDRHRLRLAPGGDVEIITSLTPTRRGDRHSDLLTLRVRGPLGLGARQASIPVPGTVRALPAFPSRRHLPSLLATLRQLDGRSALRTRGQGTEFDSLREYVDGDDVRSIDWRASARRPEIVVRTWQPERDRHVVLVLDTSRTSAGRVLDIPRLDAAMDAALLLAALAHRSGDRVDLVAGDRVTRAQVVGGRRGDVLAAMVEALAPLEAALVEADWQALASSVLARARQRAVVVLLTPLEPSAIEEGLVPVLPSLTRRHRVILASVRDPALDALARGDVGANGPAVADPPDPPDPVGAAYAAAAAEQTLAHRAHTADVLRRLGVHVLDEPPEALPLALAEHYLALKSRGLL